MPLDAKTSNDKKAFKSVGTSPIRPDGIDKVTGRARFGADMSAPGMLVGRILRSPHAHAKIKSIDTSKAEALPGVKAVITSADLPKYKDADEDILINIMARDRALYDGHTVAAVAAIDAAVAKKALKLIKVDYEIMPHVTDVDLAMLPNAPLVHPGRYDGMAENEHLALALQEQGKAKSKRKSTNIVSRYDFGHGDVKKGFKQADVIVEHEFTTEATHQGYIEPHACLANVSSDGSGELWVCTQGHFMVRDVCAALLGMDVSSLRVTPSEIGGGFGGKTTVFIEPVALALVRARPAGPSRSSWTVAEEVFTRDRPHSSSSRRSRSASAPPRMAGSPPAAAELLQYQGGALPGLARSSSARCPRSPAMTWRTCMIVRLRRRSSNRPKQAAYRAPGAPMSAFAVEGVCRSSSPTGSASTPSNFRLEKRGRAMGARSAYGPTFGTDRAWSRPSTRPRRTRTTTRQAGARIRAAASPRGFWFNFGGQHLRRASTLRCRRHPRPWPLGTPDIGGSPRLHVPDGRGGAWVFPMMTGSAPSSPTPPPSVTTTPPTAAG